MIKTYNVYCCSIAVACAVVGMCVWPTKRPVSTPVDVVNADTRECAKAPPEYLTLILRPLIRQPSVMIKSTHCILWRRPRPEVDF